MLNLFQSRRAITLPLGVDIGPRNISVVSASMKGVEFAVDVARTIDVDASESTETDLTIALTLQRLIADLGIRERRCVLAAPSSEVMTRIFHVPPGMRPAEAERAAELEADAIAPWPASERLIALDPLPERPSARLLSVARNSAVERIVSIAKSAGLQPVAVDLPACAWRRAIPFADAVLDALSERAALTIFASPVGTIQAFAPRLIDERLAASVRTALVEARRDGLADVQRLAVLSSPARYESLCELMQSDGYLPLPVRLGTETAPTWTFAYGLASWAIAPKGIAA